MRLRSKAVVSGILASLMICSPLAESAFAAQNVAKGKSSIVNSFKSGWNKIINLVKNHPDASIAVIGGEAVAAILGIAIFASSNSKSKSELITKENEYDKLKKDRDNLKGTNSKLTVQITGLNSENTDLRRQIGSLQTQLDEKNNNISTLEEEKTNLFTEVGKLNDDKQQLNKEIEELTNANEQLKNRITELGNNTNQLSKQLTLCTKVLSRHMKLKNVTDLKVQFNDEFIESLFHGYKDEVIKAYDDKCVPSSILGVLNRHKMMRRNKVRECVADIKLEYKTLIEMCPNNAEAVRRVIIERIKGELYRKSKELSEEIKNDENIVKCLDEDETRRVARFVLELPDEDELPEIKPCKN